MGNIITYVQEMGHLAFDELGFNEVDSLIFSELAYLDFTCAGRTAVPFTATLGDLLSCGLKADCPSNGVSPEKCRQLVEAMAASRRFGDVRVDDYVYELDTAEEKQFAAVTFRLSPRLHYVAYRGTDSTLVGWKEDFNMSYLTDVPAQRSAAAYFEAQCNTRRSNYILGGHSKGGNLAVYAAMSVPEKYRSQVALVYDHDGPGFREEVLARPGYAAIRSRIYKTVPESAVVGMLLAVHDRYSVVESRAVSLLQHDPFSWKVKDGRFVTVEDTDMLSKMTDSTITHWLNDTDDATRRAFVDGLFGIIGATGAQTLDDLLQNLASNIRSVAAAIGEMDPSLRRMMLTTVRSLLRASGRGVRDTVDDTLTAARSSINRTTEEWRMQTRDNFNRAREELQQARMNINQTTEGWRMQTRDSFNQAQESLAQAWEELSTSAEKIRSEYLDRFHQWIRPQK